LKIPSRKGERRGGGSGDGSGGGGSQLNGIEGNGLPSALSLFFYSHNIFFDAVMKNWKG